MKMEYEITTAERESPFRSFLSKAKCQFYEPESDMEGRCMISPNQTFVSRVAGCEHPESCVILKRRNL